MAEMEPARQTEARLRGVLDELKQREPLFHRRELGTSVEDILGQTDDGYWEVGASGRRYDRHYCAELRAQRWETEPEPWESGTWSVDDFYCQQLAPELYLLTYDLVQQTRHTRRATIWRRESGRWVAVYHQGTVVID